MNNRDNDDTRSIDSDEHGSPVLDCSRPEITTKYRTASDIVNEVLKAVVEACKPDADVATICRMGDDLIETKLSKVYNKKEKGEKIRKGIAFPTCITPNELCRAYSPFASESKTLQDGDLIKVELGCQIDGFIAVAAHTLVLTTEDITGKKADVIKAAWTAAEAALRTIKVGALNTDVTKVMNLCASQFKCEMVEEIHSHQLKQHVIDGVKSILSKDTAEEKSDVFTFESNEVYALDVIVSSGEGKLRESEYRTTVFKRDVEVNHTLKTQLARQFFREATTRYPLLPFSVGSFQDEKLCRVGVLECTRHGLFQPFPVRTERHGEYIAQFKFTVMLLPGGTKKVTGLPFSQDNQIKSLYSVTDESLKALFSVPIRPKKKTSKKVEPVQN